MKRERDECTNKFQPAYIVNGNLRLQLPFSTAYPSPSYVCTILVDSTQPEHILGVGGYHGGRDTVLEDALGERLLEVLELDLLVATLRAVRQGELRLGRHLGSEMSNPRVSQKYFYSFFKFNCLV